MLKLSTNATVALIFLSAVGSIVYMVTSDSSFAGALIPVVFTGALSAIGLVLKQQDTDAKVAAVKDDVAASTAQSQQNTATLAVMAPQVKQAVVQATEAAVQASTAVDAVADNTILTERLSDKADKTHEVFNGAAHEWKSAIEAIGRLEAEVASLKGIAAGIETERQRAKDDLAAIVPPVGDAP